MRRTIPHRQLPQSVEAVPFRKTFSFTDSVVPIPNGSVIPSNTPPLQASPSSNIVPIFGNNPKSPRRTRKYKIFQQRGSSLKKEQAETAVGTNTMPYGGWQHTSEYRFEDYDSPRDKCSPIKTAGAFQRSSSKVRESSRELELREREIEILKKEIQRCHRKQKLILENKDLIRHQRQELDAQHFPPLNEPQTNPVLDESFQPAINPFQNDHSSPLQIEAIMQPILTENKQQATLLRIETKRTPRTTGFNKRFTRTQSVLQSVEKVLHQLNTKVEENCRLRYMKQERLLKEKYGVKAIRKRQHYDFY